MNIKRMVKAVALGLVLASSAAVSSAATINVGGVVFDPASPFDFLAKGGIFERVINRIGDTAQGFGIINSINENQDATQFCPNCELTFTFSGFRLTDPNPQALLFDGGIVNFYVQNKSAAGYTAYDATKPQGNAGDGTLWLTAVGHTDTRFGYSGSGTLFGKIDSGLLGSGTERGQGGGLLDVTGGLASTFLNTNGERDSFGRFADLNFTTTFLPTQEAAIAAGAPPLTGNATFTGNSVNAVPEPATLLLLGAGLAGLGFTGKRRKAAVVAA